MQSFNKANGGRRAALRLAVAVAALLPIQLAPGGTRPVGEEGRMDPAFERWLEPQAWRREGDQPVLSLGEKGKFDDQHIFAPHVIRLNGEYWMYYSGLAALCRRGDV